MKRTFTFPQINSAGRLESSFLAEVCCMEEGFLESARPTPYLRIMLTQNDGATVMVAIATGDFYDVAKSLYEVGKASWFPRGMFEIRPRTSQDSWSTYPYELWFLNDSGTVEETSDKSCQTSEWDESMQDMGIF
ncbi:hypothetical protein Fcan01_20153 [Folsomia candida]|uniref:Uncharacterized protein n=1 Tax=Folsomia candida TaxID=158441 RepID=A0A226DI61_FOLCA|nr:hypothetical protein Fcan01_20153 [Folsomia candida]